ncbi:MAG TPA: glycosyltransferase family 2 protein [Bryobacteraceae bacterium]|jgi:glycosyltransferase involved in cell wall biosynthesis
MERSDVFIVIPAFNENSVITHTVAEVVNRGYTAVVVDDGSTVPVENFLTGLPVYRLRHAINLGQGAALRTGCDFALAKGARIIVHFDADGQHDPDLIERLIAPIRAGEADVALGSRFLKESDSHEVPAVKRVLLRAGVFVSWVFTGMWLSDAHNGFRALSRVAAEKIRLEENGFAHATEILELVRRSRLPWVEVPVTIHYSDYSRAKGQSVLNSFNILFDLMLRRLFH